MWRDDGRSSSDVLGSGPPPLAVASGAAPEPGCSELLAQWNATDAAYPDVCTHELFERQVERSPDAVAVVFQERRLTYRELNQRANQVAHLLRRRGVGPETLVGVALRRSPELVVALLGVWKAGGAYVPLDPTYPPERLAFMVRDAGLRTLLTEEACRELFAPGSAEVLCLDTDRAAISGEDAGNSASGAHPSNLAYVMYTSGSTGRPKGAMILHGGLVNYLHWAIRAYGADAAGSAPVHSSISFDLTVTSLYPVLLTGGRAELLPEDTGAQNLLAALRREGDRTLVKITPAHLDLLTRQLRPEELAGLTRTFVIGGENLPAESLQSWRDHAPGTRLINEYGPTETVVGCCVHEVRPEDPRNGPVPIGRPIANTQLHVLGPDLRPVAVGVAGELFIGGAGVARGYLNQPELTRERFLPDTFSGRPGARLYRTGDLARYRSDGTLEYLGRSDDQVKVRGYRIELGEIEAVLAAHPAVHACAVIAREDEPGDRRLVGYVVPRAGASPSPEQLQEFLGRQLPEYMTPSLFAILEALPLTPNGKVDRRALPAPAPALAPGSAAFAAPQGETETALAALWAELLHVERVGRDDDFFQLGGHSLLAVRTLSRVAERFQVELPLQDLFENPTVTSLAAAILKAKGTTESVARIASRAPGPAPLSFSQEQFWFLAQLAPESPAYNIVDVVTFHGELDSGALRRAVAELVRRHEILRTVVSWAGGRLVQRVQPAFEPELPELDLAELPVPERQGRWEQAVREDGRRPFDVTQLPLFRAKLVHWSRDEHRLLVTIHHLVADEWSMELVHRELNALHQAFSLGRRSPLPELPIQYADFACWQRETLDEAALRQQLDHWKAELAGAPVSLALPVDLPRPATPSFRGATEAFTLPRQLRDRLYALAREERATAFMVLEAAFAALLHRYTGQDDILIGTPISRRTVGETEQLIGCFLNTVVLRAKFEPGETFRSSLRQARERALDAYAHADLPVEWLVAELATERDSGRTPLFQVMFILHDAGGVSQVSKASGNRALETGTSKFELTLTMSEGDDGLEGLFEYSTDLFEGETIRRLAGHLGTLLEAVVAAPDRELARVSILSEAERRRLLVEWNDTAVAEAEQGLCLHQLLEQQAHRTPERVAVSCGAEKVTYGELDARAERLARRLRQLGVGPDVLVGVLVERSIDMVVAVLGTLKAGGAYVPLDPSFPADRLAYMVESSGMRVLVTHRGLEGGLRARPAEVVDLDRGWPEEAGAGAGPFVPPSGEHLAYVLYTSGSTGRPKGVGIPHAAIVNFLLSMRREPGLTANDTVLAVTTLSFDIAGLELYLPLLVGGRAAVATREDAIDPLRLMERMRTSGCTVMQATPATWRMLLEAGWKGDRRLRMFVGGESLASDLAARLLERGSELWNLYGPTETTVWSTVHRVTSAEEGSSVPIGHPIANTQVYVVDARNELVPVGVAGELYIGGDGLARGYLGRPELTEERFVPNPFVPGARMYRTGDLARWRADGVLECLGRTDHQIKLRGYRIEPAEIEAGLKRHPAVKQAVVVAREDVPGDKRLVAYLVADEGPSLSDAALRELLRAEVPEYMVPSHFVTVKAFPLTPNGKVDRNALPPPDRGPIAADATAYVAPRNDVETRMALIWRDVLKLDRIGIEQDFFALGGTSVLLVEARGRIAEEFGVELPLRAFFESPTVAGLVKRLEDRKPDDGPVIVTLRRGPPELPPLFCLLGIQLYQDIAEALPDDRTVVGMHIPTRSDRLAPVEDLAVHYVDAIRRYRPTGPYHLLGLCYGGVVAYEVARRLEAAGETVGVVVIIDALLPGGVQVDPWARLASYAVKSVSEPGTLARWVAERVRSLVRPLHEALPARIMAGRTSRLTEPPRLDLPAVQEQLRRYERKTGPVQAHVVVVRARQSHLPPWATSAPDLGWRRLAPQLSVEEVDANHVATVRDTHAFQIAHRIAALMVMLSSGGPP